MPSIIHTLIYKVLSLIFPDKCLGCGKNGEVLCRGCIEGSKRNVRNKKSVLFLDHLFYWGVYEYRTLGAALRRFKYHGVRSLAHPFSDMMAQLLAPHRDSFKKDTLLIPIPAHEMRKIERGYNQAELLAEKLSQKTLLPMDSKILLKSKNTKSQTPLSGVERICNVKDSFSVKNPEAVKNKKIILVDDITTTGSTLSEATRVLKDAGALEVTGVVIAR